MGKGRNKNKDKDSCTSAAFGSKSRAARQGDYSDSDCESESTHLTFDDDLRSVQGDAEVDEEESNLMDSLAEHVENASHKSVSIRLAALRHLQFALTSRYLPEFTSKWRVTLIDLSTKAVKKTDDEFAAGSQLLALVAVQIGQDAAADVGEPLAVMRSVVTDSARAVGVRCLAALSIGLTAHLACDSEDTHAKCTKALADTWTSFKVGAQSCTTLFCSALSSWCLLAGEGVLPQSTAFAEQPRLLSLLEGNQLDMRIAAGEALAFLYEMAAASSHRFANHDHLAHILEGLASDGGKNRTKRDKRVQKFTFRQIYSFIVENDSPSLTIKFQGGSLLLDSCHYKLLYDLCCAVLRGGMMRQLKENSHLRELFNMGEPVEESGEKMAKQSRMHIQNSINKVRDQQRARQRGKRAMPPPD